MLTLKGGRVIESGTESTGELLMPGFWPLLSAEASRHRAPLPGSCNGLGCAGAVAASRFATASEAEKLPAWRVNLISLAETLPV